MKFLVILLCLLSERYLVHAASYYRFYWFTNYVDYVNQRLPTTGAFRNPYLLLLVLVLPLAIILWLLIVIFAHLLAGFIGFLISLAVFYYCMGPENIFYPINKVTLDNNTDVAAGSYFTSANQQLFAVIFWFMVIGPIGALIYRLIYLCQKNNLANAAAIPIMHVLDWIPTRITLLLYLLAGNFQQGFQYYKQAFVASPKYNDVMLYNGGLLAARVRENESVSLANAQHLVEHALVIYLVILAFTTLIGWCSL